MRKTVRLAVSGSAIPLLLAVAACGGAETDPTNALDSNITAAANEADPALTSALEDQIMVDPTLAAQSNAKSVRPADGPAQAPIPPSDEPGGAPAPAAVSGERLLSTPAPTRNPQVSQTLGDLARTQNNRTAAGQNKDCDNNFRYSMSWADRLPAAVPLYPDARVTEAAGNECRTRIVSFTTRAALRSVMDWYYTTTRRNGFTSEHQIVEGDHVLGGTKGEAAYYLTFRPAAGGGTEVDLVANQGR